MNKLAKTMLFIVMMILIAGNVLAIGVAPARITLDFEPGLKKDVTLKIINNEGKDFKALIRVKGELAQYVEIEDELVPIFSNENRKEINYEVSLPEKLERAGTHEAEIVIIELPITYGEKDKTVVTATAGVISQLRVNVPYPGKYLEARSLIVSEIVEGAPITFTIPVKNLGEENLNNIHATITLLDSSNQQITELTTNTMSMPTKSESKLVAVLNEPIGLGEYAAVIKISYDGKEKEFTQKVFIGNIFIDIISVNVGKFTLGEIAKFDIWVENKWNKEISNVFAETKVMDDEGRQLTSFKTPSTDIEPKSKEKLEAYWDTTGVAPGLYNLNIALDYAGRTTERLFRIQVGFSNINVITPTGQIISGEDSFIKQNQLLIFLVVVLIAINVFWFIYLKKRKNR